MRDRERLFRGIATKANAHRRAIRRRAGIFLLNRYEIDFAARRPTPSAGRSSRTIRR
jgi:hypothetical protein